MSPTFFGRTVTRLAALAPALVVPAISIAAQEHAHPAQVVSSTPAPSVKPGPPVLVNVSREPNTVEVTITAEPARLSLVAGSMTSAYAYNGRVPGPTLEIKEGDKVIVHFRNNLPVPSTIHWHGLHVPVTSDGSPYYLVQPGKQYDYVFTIQHGTAGTYWYHPHPDHTTGEQIAKGLYGAVIVRPAKDPLPAALAEKIFILSDNRFLADGAIDLPDPLSPQGRIDRENGREGDIIFVNGQVMPTLSIRPGEIQRWRIINASASRVYRLAIPGHSLLHVGNDGGLFEHPIEVKNILIANSERVELLVRGTGAPGERTVLQTLPYDRYIPQTKPENWNAARDLLTIQYTTESRAAAPPIPATLRAIPAIDTTQVTATRVMSLTQGFINGKTHDMNRVDVTAKLGATEIWVIENLVGMDHPFHLHGFQFQVLDRNGVPEGFRSWKDTVNIPKHGTVRFVVRYADYPGKWMFHCHILDHEDHGMMGVLEVQ